MWLSARKIKRGGQKEARRQVNCLLRVFLEAVRLPRWLSGEESTWQCRRHGLDPWVGKIPWRRKWQPAPVFLPGKSHGQRSLGGYSPWGHKESDMTERLSTHPPLLCSNQHLMPSTHLLQPPCPQSPHKKKDDISPTIIIPGISGSDHSCPSPHSPSTVGPALNPGKLQMSNCCIYLPFAQGCPLVVKHRRERGQEVLQEGPEKAMAPHSSTLAWKIPWLEEPGGLWSMGSLRVGHD